MSAVQKIKTELNWPFYLQSMKQIELLGGNRVRPVSPRYFVNGLGGCLASGAWCLA